MNAKQSRVSVIFLGLICLHTAEMVRHLSEGEWVIYFIAVFVAIGLANWPEK
jgi:hypothetical protein